MLEVKLRLYSTLREIVGEDKFIMNVPEGSSVKELIRSLLNQYEEKFRERYGLLIKKDLEDRFLVFVNDNSIYSFDGFETKLKDKDKVDILEPILGG